VLRMRNGTPSPPFALRSATACKCPDSPRSGTAGYSTPRLRPCPYDEWLDGGSNVLAYRLRGSRTSGPYATAAIRTHLPLSGTTRRAICASMAGSEGEKKECENGLTRDNPVNGLIVIESPPKSPPEAGPQRSDW